MSTEEAETQEANPKKRGLGRGLDALFEDEEGVYPQVDEEGHTPGRGHQMIHIDQIHPNPDQPRRYFDPASVKELADSIKEHGILQPILVRADKQQDGHFEIVAGERRWRASQLAQYHEIPVVIVDMDDEEVFKVALVENLQREDLNPVEEAQGYQNLIENYNYTQEQVADIVGKSRPHVANMVRLMKLPVGIHQQLIKGELSMGHARAILKAEDPILLAQEIIDFDLTVRQAERRAAQSTGRKQEKRPGHKKKTPKDADTLALETELSNLLGMRVNIDSGDGQTGKVTVDFKSLDQLDEILKRLTG